MRKAFRARVRETTVLVDGRRVASLGGRTSKRVDLRGRVRSTVTVKLVMRLAGGRRVTDVRRYRVCVTR